MLSDAIRQMIAVFREYEDTGIQMAPEVVAAHRQIFQAWRIEAANMEQRLDQLGPHVPVLPPVASENVVPFRRPS